MTETSYTVVNDLIRGRIPSRMGMRENVWGQTLTKWVEQGYPVDADGKPIEPAVHFNHDWANAGGGFNYWPLRDAKEVIEETDDWQIVRNGSGADLRYWKTQAGTPEHVAFSMTSRTIWDETYRPHLLDFDPERLNLERTKELLAERREQRKFALFGNLFVFEHMRQSMGDMCLYESFAMDPDWVHDYCSVLTDFFIAHYDATIKAVGKPDAMRVCEDLGYKGRLFCSPESLRELVFPYHKKLVDFFHSHDIPVILHSCGMVEDALPMILEAGFDALDPMERAAGCDPKRFAELTKGKLLLIGGFDKRTLESGDRPAMRREVEDLLGFMRDNRVRYVFSTDHSLSTQVDYPDYQYLVDVYRDNMYY